MKKIVILLIFLLLTGCGCNKNIETDAKKFKNEYEYLNAKINPNNNKEYMKMSIDEENPMVYATYDEIKELIKKGTAVIYFGFPECPWCRNTVPVLIDAAKEMGIEKIYYYNAVSIRDKKSLDDNGNIVVEDEGTKEYKELVELLYNYLPVYNGLNDDSIKRLYLPTVLFVKDGEIMGLHTSTVESQEDPYVELTKEQYNELKNIFSDYINKTFEIVCDEAC